MLKMPRLPRQMQRRQSDPVRRQASADIYMKVLKASRLPGKSSCFTLATSSAAASVRRQVDPVRRQASADIYPAESATAAPQIKRRSAVSVTPDTSNATQIVAKLPDSADAYMKGLKVPHLPGKSSLKC